MCAEEELEAIDQCENLTRSIKNRKLCLEAIIDGVGGIAGAQVQGCLGEADVESGLNIQDGQTVDLKADEPCNGGELWARTFQEINIHEANENILPDGRCAYEPPKMPDGSRLNLVGIGLYQFLAEPEVFMVRSMSFLLMCNADFRGC